MQRLPPRVVQAIAKLAERQQHLVVSDFEAGVVDKLLVGVCRWLAPGLVLWHCGAGCVQNAALAACMRCALPLCKTHAAGGELHMFVV